MNKQITLSMISDELAKAKTSKKEFLDKMEKLIPWEEFKGIISRFITKEKLAISPTNLN